jgi:hypothetical protein
MAAGMPARRLLHTRAHDARRLSDGGRDNYRHGLATFEYWSGDAALLASTPSALGAMFAQTPTRGHKDREAVRLSVREYDEVRIHPTHFIVARARNTSRPMSNELSNGPTAIGSSRRRA